MTASPATETASAGAASSAGATASHGGQAAPDVELLDVTKRFGDVTAVDRMHLRIARGSFYSFLGPSGCGKTTTLRMIAGFEQPTDGEILLAGQPIAGVPPEAQKHEADGPGSQRADALEEDRQLWVHARGSQSKPYSSATRPAAPTPARAIARSVDGTTTRST